MATFTINRKPLYFTEYVPAFTFDGLPVSSNVTIVSENGFLTYQVRPAPVAAGLSEWEPEVTLPPGRSVSLTRDLNPIINSAATDGGVTGVRFRAEPNLPIPTVTCIVSQEPGGSHFSPPAPGAVGDTLTATGAVAGPIGGAGGLVTQLLPPSNMVVGPSGEQIISVAPVLYRIVTRVWSNSTMAPGNARLEYTPNGNLPAVSAPVVMSGTAGIIGETVFERLSHQNGSAMRITTRYADSGAGVIIAVIEATPIQ